MDLGLKDKVAMVAGGSRGLGYAAARALAGEGARVSLFSRDEAALAEAVETLQEETGSEALSFAGDLRSADAIAQWRERTVERFGGVDLLFANTGGPPAGRFPAIDDQAWEDGFTLLLLPVIRMIREVVPHMKSAGGGSIVVSTSSGVKVPLINITVSTVIRASVASLAKTLSEEYADDGIRVNHLIPGRIDTDRVRSLDEGGAKRAGISVEEQKARSEAGIPLGRYGKPEEYGRAAAFLLSDAASYITGASLQVDGGLIRTVQ